MSAKAVIEAVAAFKAYEQKLFAEPDNIAEFKQWVESNNIDALMADAEKIKELGRLQREMFAAIHAYRREQAKKIHIYNY